MQNFFRLPEITVRILVRPTIGHLLYFVQVDFTCQVHVVRRCGGVLVNA